MSDEPWGHPRPSLLCSGSFRPSGVYNDSVNRAEHLLKGGTSCLPRSERLQTCPKVKASQIPREVPQVVTRGRGAAPTGRAVAQRGWE